MGPAIGIMPKGDWDLVVRGNLDIVEGRLGSCRGAIRILPRSDWDLVGGAIAILSKGDWDIVEVRLGSCRVLLAEEWCLAPSIASGQEPCCHKGRLLNSLAL